MKHAFSVIAVGLAACFVVIFFTGRIDGKQLPSVAPRVGMQAEQLDAVVQRVATQTGATLGTTRRVVFYLACSGLATATTIETQATQAADLSKKQRFTPREAALVVLSGKPTDASHELLRDC